MRRWILGVLLAAGLLTGSLVVAADTLQGTACTVPVGTVIEGNLYVLCRDLIVDGEVQGSVIGAAFTAQISGDVTESLYMIAARLEISGQVAGDVHFGGLALEIVRAATLPRASVLSAALSVNLQPGAVVPGHAVGLGYQWVVDGALGGNLDFWGAALRVSGEVGGDVTASVGDARSVGVAGQIQNLLFLLPFGIELFDPGLTIAEQGRVDGDLKYQAVTPGFISGTVAGETRFDELRTEPTLADLVEEEASRTTAFELYLRQLFREFTTLLLVGGAVLLVAPGWLQSPLYVMRRSPLSSLGLGMLVFILSFPVMLLVLIFSLLVLLFLAFLRLDGVLIVSALFFGVTDLGGAGLFYFIAIFLARVLTCLALGRLIVRRFTVLTTPRGWLLALVAGVGLLSIFASLPVVGWVVNALAMFIGLGAMVNLLQAAPREQSAPAAPPTYYTVEQVRVLPPPVLDDAPRPRGMDNLPDGFKWWDE